MVSRPSQIAVRAEEVMVSRLAILSCAILAASTAALAHDLSGIIRDHTGAPVAQATVWVSQDRAVRTTRTDADGRFTFKDVDSGPVKVIARKEGHALGGVEGYIIESLDLNIVLAQPDALHLVVTDMKIEPIEGARVKTLYINNTFHVPVEDLVLYGFPSVRSGPGGVLEITELPKGGYVSFVLSHSRHAERAMVTVPVGTEIGVPLTDGVKIRGRITNVENEGVARARVSFFRFGTSSQREYAEVLSDSEGFYRAIVPPSDYYVTAKHIGYAIPEPVPVHAPMGPHDIFADLTLPPAHVVRGSTVDTDGAPIARVKLTYVSDGKIYAETLSDMEGRFSITVSGSEGVLQVSPPRFMVTVAHPEIPIALRDTPEILLAPIELKGLPEIVGRIESRDGTDLDKILVSTLGLEVPYFAVTDEEGRFRIRIEQMPVDAKVRVRAEHALRFERREFVVNLLKSKQVNVRLKSFKPDFPQKDDWSANALEHMVDEAAPEIHCDAWFNLTGEAAEKGSLSLADLRGKVIVLTLWGGFQRDKTGRSRIEQLRSLHYLFRDVEDVAIIAVHDAGTEPDVVGQYVRDYGIEFPVGCDADPFLTFDYYNVNFIPQTVLIDATGKLRYYKVDGRLMELIKDLRRKV